MRISKMKIEGASLEPKKSVVETADRLAYHLEMIVQLEIDAFLKLKIKKDLENYYEAKGNK